MKEVYLDKEDQTFFRGRNIRKEELLDEATFAAACAGVRTYFYYADHGGRSYATSVGVTKWMSEIETDSRGAKQLRRGIEKQIMLESL